MQLLRRSCQASSRMDVAVEIHAAARLRTRSHKLQTTCGPVHGNQGSTGPERILASPV